MSDISVLVVDDHAVFAEAVQARLAAEPGLGPVWVSGSATDARDRVARYRPAVVLLDVFLGADNGLDLVPQWRHSAPDSRVVMLSGTCGLDQVVVALRRGARAWLPKTVAPERLVRAIRGVHRGEVWVDPMLLGQVLDQVLAGPAEPADDPLGELTPRERQVLQSLINGQGRAAIAVQLGVSTNTVRTHTQNLLAKLGAHSTLELVAVGLRHGLRASDS